MNSFEVGMVKLRNIEITDKLHSKTYELIDPESDETTLGKGTRNCVVKKGEYLFKGISIRCRIKKLTSHLNGQVEKKAAERVQFML